MNRKVIPSFFFRLKARTAMKPVLQTLLLLALIAMLPSLISQTVTILTGANPSHLLAEFSASVAKLEADSGLEGEALDAALLDTLMAFAPQAEAFLTEKGPLVIGTNALTLILGPVLMLPLLYGALLALRKQPFTLAEPLSRVRVGLKALGVSLMSTLKTVLWMLPGYAVLIAGVLLAMAVNESIGMLLTSAGGIAATVMGVMAAFRYMMAPYVLADKPDAKVMACIRRSCEIMAHRKFELFGLRLSYLGWELLLSLAQSLLMGLLGSIIGMTLGMALNLVLQVYIFCGEAAFYEAYANGVDPVKMPMPDAPQEELT